MRAICENYADEYEKKMFNASKIQLLYFTKCNTQEKNTVKMNKNRIIESTDKCVYLRIPLHGCTLNNDMSSTVRDFNRRVNNLLADFSFVDSNTYSTLSFLFDSYCMSMILVQNPRNNTPLYKTPPTKRSKILEIVGSNEIGL